MIETKDDSSVYIRRIEDLAADPDCKDYLAANKYLLERPWEKARVGRPSLDSIHKEAERLVADKAEMEAHYERLFPQKDK